MNVLQLLTYRSPDGSYGGPARVALLQCKALTRIGATVTLVAASPAASSTRHVDDGVLLIDYPSRRLPRLGFAGMSAPSMLRSLSGLLSSTDVAHVHLARDLVTLPAAGLLRRAGVPYVVQAHGMVDPSDKLLAWPLDRFATRPYLESATAVLVLTDEEERHIHAVAPKARVARIRNGIEVGPIPPYFGRNREVVFLARLHPRKRATAFVEAAALVAPRHPDVRFVIAGPDEGDASAVQAAVKASGLEERVSWIGSVDMSATDSLLASAAVYVLPSVGEVFPMSLLEAFRNGTPSVVTDSLGIADKVRKYGAGVVTDGSPVQLAEGISAILSDPAVAERLRAGALDYLQTELDINVVAQDLVRHYEAAL